MIDLDDLAGLCPGLPPESARSLTFRAVIALQRRHLPGVELLGNVRGEALREPLMWRKLPATIARMEDLNRVTEEGAEALALALVGRRGGWRAKRRLQSRRSEGADWLMVDGDAKIILEVGGTDDGDLEALYRRKIKQAEEAAWPKGILRAACVVRFVEPQVLFWSNHGP